VATPSLADDAEPVENPVPAPSRNPLKTIWQRKSIVLLGLVVGLVLAGLYFARCSAIYQSTAQVLVVKKRSDVVSLGGNDSRVAFYDDYVSTHLVLIKSPLIVERAVKKRSLRALKSFEEQGDAASAIIGSLAADRDAKKDTNAIPNNIINLSYRGPVAEECGVVLKAIIDSYKDFLDETYRNVNDNTLELITKARDLLEKDLLEKEKKYRTFRQKSPLLWQGKDGANVHRNRIADFENKRSVLLIREAEVQTRLEAIAKAEKGKAGTAALLALATVPREKPTAPPANPARTIEEQLFGLLLQEQTLLEDYGVDHPQVVSVRKKIAMAREVVMRQRSATSDGAPSAEAEKDMTAEQLLAARIRSLNLELNNIRLAVGSLDRLLAAEEKVANGLKSYEIQEEAFVTDIARTRELYEQTIKQLQGINLARDFGGYESRIISPPRIGAKVFPKANQIFLAGAILGILAGAGLAYLADVLDKSFRTPEEIRRRLGLPVLGHIPFIEHGEDTLEATGTNGRPLRLGAALSTYLRPTSLEAEAFRGVRTAIFFSTRGERHKVIQVTSPGMGDGKSTLAANLAISIAQSGKSVVLLDADFRRPRVHRLFEISSQAGLASLILGQGELPDAVQESGIAGLSLLPSGPRPCNPAELLSSPRLDELLQDMRERYDFVIIDTPPLLAVTDPCVVAPRVDGILLTIRIAKNGRPAAERAREILVTLGVPVFGVVVNGVGGGPGANGYGSEHYHYANEYGYEYSNHEEEAATTALSQRVTVSDPGSSGGFSTSGDRVMAESRNGSNQQPRTL
jgi:capsular exopolysaccharide synthesis family protein